MITSLLKEKIVKLNECKDIFPVEQKDTKKESYGQKDQLFINNTIMEKYRLKRKILSISLVIITFLKSTRKR